MYSFEVWRFHYLTFLLPQCFSTKHIYVCGSDFKFSQFATWEESLPWHDGQSKYIF